jgi:hypothetical protein
MGAKAEIGWTRRDDAGERWDVYARRVGRDWKFFIRQRRYEQWQPLANPPLEDWLELLDALRRLTVRRRYQPDDVEQLEKKIRERFPEAEF